MASLTWVCLCGTSYPIDIAVCELDGRNRPTLDSAQRDASSCPDRAAVIVDVGQSDTVECPGCGRPNPHGAVRCLKCGDLLPSRVAAGLVQLVLPGGAVVCLSDGEVVVLGREADDPVIRASLEVHDQVSRRHAALIVVGPTVRVRDLRSANGTYVNDLPVADETTVPIGDGVRVRFGKELELVLLPGGVV